MNNYQLALFYKDEERVVESMKTYLNKDEIRALYDGRHKDPHHLLGMHSLDDKTSYINVYQPFCDVIQIRRDDTEEVIDLEKVDDGGLFSAEVSGVSSYTVIYTNYEGITWERKDPYSYGPILSDLDLYLFGQGTHYEIYNKLGANVMTIDGVTGCLFAVWAPNAEGVSVVGDFTGWDGRLLPMRGIGESGVFELFVPGLGVYERYKFEIHGNNGQHLLKADPYAKFAELRPNTASVIWDLETYEWKDREWINKRRRGEPHAEPMSIYECHLGSWMRDDDSEHGYLTYEVLAQKLVAYVKDMGFTHIELMPVSEHPFDGSWGYQVTGYYAPTSRFGNPDAFKYFVDHCHEEGIGVIMDWVPAHFPKDAHGLYRFDGSALYEHADARQGEHPHWGTMIYNYGRNEVKNFLIANALYWIETYHIDGLRVDAVASMLYLDYGKESGEWIPNPHGGRENIDAVEFFKHLNSVVYGRNPGITMIAEESTAWPGVSKSTEIGGLGFGFKWNMGWMNDFLRYMAFDPIHRQYHHNDLTFSMVYAFTENFILVLSHDEVVHGKGSMINKMPGDYWQQFANLRTVYGFMAGHPGKQLMFMGDEIGQFNEWAEDKSLDWVVLEYEKHQQLQLFVKDLNHFYKKEAALWEIDFESRGFGWINCSDSASSIISFYRQGESKDEGIVVVANFTPVPHTMHRIGVPYEGIYEEVLNSDELKYGGSGITNKGPLRTQKIAWDNLPYCIDIKVPPLGTVFYKWTKKA